MRRQFDGPELLAWERQIRNVSLYEFYWEYQFYGGRLKRSASDVCIMVTPRRLTVPTVQMLSILLMKGTRVSVFSLTGDTLIPLNGMPVLSRSLAVTSSLRLRSTGALQDLSRLLHVPVFRKMIVTWGSPISTWPLMGEKMVGPLA